MKVLILLAMAAVFCLCTITNAEMRIWTSKRGDSVEAEYVKMYGGKAMLKTADGRTIPVPVDGLCDDDQEYLAHVAAVPPQLEVTVDEDIESDKNILGGYREALFEMLTMEVTVRKRNPEPCVEQFMTELYILGREKKNNRHYSLLDIVKRDVAFVESDRVTITENFKIKSEVGYSWSRGFKYEGYLFCVKNSVGEVVVIESNQNILERNLSLVLQSKKGDEYTEDFIKVN